LYYARLAPWYQVHYRDVESYRRDGDRTVIGLAGNSKIDIDWKSLRYSVTADGVEVAGDGNTFCPVGKDRIAFYSKKGARLSAPLPGGWDARSIVALAMYTDRAESAPVAKDGGRVTVEVAAGRPVLVFRDAEAAKRAR